MNTSYLLDLESRIRRVVGPGEHPLHVPQTSSRTSVNLLRALDDSKISVSAELESEAARMLGRITGVTGVVLTSSGTSALHLTLLALGVSHGDKVVCPALSFVATANAILYCGAEPTFLDVEEDSLGLSPEGLRAYLETLAVRKLRGGADGEGFPTAIVVVAVFGLVPRLDELQGVAEEFGLPIVIDGAGALGSQDGSESLLTRGTAAITSFNGNKIVSCGAGGAILSKNEELLDKCQHLSRVAKVPHPFEFHHDALGFNYRLPALNAALLMDQLSKFPKILDAKRNLHKRYCEAFLTSEHTIFNESEGTKSNYWSNSIYLASHELSSLETCEYLNNKGLGVRPLWHPLPRLSHLRRFCTSASFEVTDRLATRVVSLPSSYTIEGLL